MGKMPKAAMAKEASVAENSEKTGVASAAPADFLIAEEAEQLAAVEDVDVAVDSTVERLGKLFEYLKISKIVFVDDKAEPEIDAGTVTKALAANEAAAKALAPFFPGVALTLENDALGDQVAARLDELDAEKRKALRSILIPQNDDVEEREALGRLRDLLPEGTPAELLTPHAWHEKREGLLAQCKEDNRTLFLFDQDLEVKDVTLGFSKGSDIIRDMAAKEREGFGTRWFCGMLTHTVGKADEVASWRLLEKSEKLDLRFFMPIAKANLDEAPAFYGAVYRTIINTYCQTMKSLAQDAFKEALKDALERFADLDPIDFEHMVVKSSEVEGVSELETIIRLYGIIQRDQVKSQILKQARVDDFSGAARKAKDVANIGRALSANSQERLHRLRREELYEDDQLVNNYHDPLRNGDLFEIGEGDDLKLWVLVAQPCDLMVRSDGKRVREDNFKVAVLAPLRTRPLGAPPGPKEGLTFSLEHYDHGGAQSAIVQFADATPANLQVLDLAVFNKDGQCQLAPVPDPTLSLPSQAWMKRDKELRKYFQKVTKQIEDARIAHKDAVAGLIAEAVIPRCAPKKSFARYGVYEAGGFKYPIRRCGHIRDPLAASLLSAYSRFLARDAYEHDYSRATD